MCSYRNRLAIGGCQDDTTLYTANESCGAALINRGIESSVLVDLRCIAPVPMATLVHICLFTGVKFSCVTAAGCIVL